MWLPWAKLQLVFLALFSCYYWENGCQVSSAERTRPLSCSRTSCGSPLLTKIGPGTQAIQSGAESPTDQRLPRVEPWVLHHTYTHANRARPWSPPSELNCWGRHFCIGGGLIGVSIPGMRHPGCPTGVTLAQCLAHNRSSLNICVLNEWMVFTRAFVFAFSQGQRPGPQRGERLPNLTQFWVFISLVWLGQWIW